MGGACAVVVVNYATSHLLATCLDPLAQLDDVRIVVVDNYSSWKERAEVNRLCADRGWALVERGNVGFGAAVNAGVEYLGVCDPSTCVVLLNPDAQISPDSLMELRGAVERDQHALVAPVVMRPDGTVWSDVNELLLHDGRMRSSRSAFQGDARDGVVRWVSGACMAISMGLWRTVDGFSPQYFMYWEDVDLCMKVLQAGGRIVSLENATAIHAEGGSQTSSGSGDKSDLYYFYNIRNRLLFAALRLPPPVRRRWRRHVITAGWSVLVRGGRRQILHRPQLLLLAMRASWEGWKQSRLSGAPKKIRVLLSFPPARPTSNPYNTLLAESLQARHDVELRNFTWRNALLWKFDVFHAHWPETMTEGRTPARSRIRQMLFGAFLARVTLGPIAWVRTRHNVDLPQGISRAQRLLLGWAEAVTDLVIVLNPATPFDITKAVAFTPHGDYQEWFRKMPRLQMEQGRLLLFGAIRGYKGVPGLVEAFGQVQDPHLRLMIAGRPSHPQHESDLREVAAADPRVSLRFTFLSDPELVGEVTRSELVILPYPHMHNSGSVIAALSLDRPVLVPDNDVNRLLQSEVGPGWVVLFESPLRPDDIHRALSEVREGRRVRPDLSRRSWDTQGVAHEQAYRRALDAKRGRAPDVFHDVSQVLPVDDR